jgi:hypothetical protein
LNINRIAWNIRSKPKKKFWKLSQSVNRFPGIFASLVEQTRRYSGEKRPLHYFVIFFKLDDFRDSQNWLEKEFSMFCFFVFLIQKFVPLIEKNCCFPVNSMQKEFCVCFKSIHLNVLFKINFYSSSLILDNYFLH